MGTDDQNRKRQSHVIPGFYLKKFAAQGKLFVYEKGKPTRHLKVKGRKAIEECRERDYFECDLGGKDTANSIENWLAEIEGKAGDVYSKIVSGKSLSGDEAHVWAIFIASLFLRGRKVRNQLGPAVAKEAEPILLGDEHIRELQHDLFVKGRLIPHHTIQAHARKVWTELQSSAHGHLISITYSTPNLARLLLSKTWYSVGVPSDSRVLTSDSPVVTMKLVGSEAYPGFGFGMPDVAIVLPMSPKRVFIASPPDRWWRDFDMEVSPS